MKLTIDTDKLADAAQWALRAGVERRSCRPGFPWLGERTRTRTRGDLRSFTDVG